MSFKTQVEDIVGGTVSDTGALEDFLTIAARKILNVLPDSVLDKYASYLALTNNSTSLAEYRILEVMRGEKICRRIGLYGESQARDSSSSKYATNYTPVFLLRDGVVRLYPAVTAASLTVQGMGMESVTINNGGTGYQVNDTFELDSTGGTYGEGIYDKGLVTVTEVDAGVITAARVTYPGNWSDLPDSFTLVASSVHGTSANLEVKWKVLTVSVVSGGTDYQSDLTTITFSGGGGTGAVATATVASGIITAVAVTNGGNNYTSFPSVSASGNFYGYVVAYPSVTNSATTITDFPPSLYQAVVIDASILYLIRKAIESLNVSSALSTFTAPTAPTALVAPSISIADASIGSYSATTIGSLGTAPTYTKPPATVTAFTDSGIALTAEDIELSEGHLSKQKTYLENYQLDIQNELNEFNKELSEYQSTVQKAIEQARLDQQRLLETANKTTDLNLANKARSLEAQVASYGATIQRYQAEVANYGNEVNYQVSKLGSLLQKGIQEAQGYLTMIPALKAEYNAILEAFLR